MIRLVPDACGSDQEHARFFSDDVATLDALELRVELRRIERALVTTHRHARVLDREWLIQRRARLLARAAA